MSETFSYENLIAGSQQPLVNAAATIAEGQSISRGALLGKILRSLGDVSPDPGNTGDGSIESVSLGARARVGTYDIECIDVGTPAVFSVVNPDGQRLADATAEVAYEGEINFTIEAYGSAFAEGDLFTVDVEAGSGHLKQADLDNTDGSAAPYAIAAEDVDATSDPVLTSVYVKGEFNERAVGYAAGEDADDWRDACAAIGIYLRPSVSTAGVA